MVGDEGVAGFEAGSLARMRCAVTGSKNTRGFGGLDIFTTAIQATRN
jgi:hypothetical protein